MALLQIWVPFQMSLFDDESDRDWHRAQDEWQGEDRIWLMPYAKEVSRWEVSIGCLRFQECLIPSERPNVISVFHVDESRRTYPPLSSPNLWRKPFPSWFYHPIERWQQVLPEGFYRQWFNITPRFFECSKQSVLMQVPVAADGKVSYTQAELEFEPGALLPLAGSEEKGNRVGEVDAGPIMSVAELGAERFERDRIQRFLWPPPGVDAPPLVSPEAESRRLYGQGKYESVVLDGEDIQAVISEKDPEKWGVSLWLRWPPPFDALFLTGGGADLPYHHTVMRQCIKDLKSDQYEKVLRKAEGWVNYLSGEGRARQEKAWFLPKAMVNTEAALFDVLGRFGIDANDLTELEKSDHFHEMMVT